MKESVFQREVTASIEAAGGKAFKIPDFPQSMLRGSRFNPVKPFDIFGCVKGLFHAIECKQTKGYEAFGLRHMRPGQVTALDAINAAGGHSWVFLNVRAHRLNKLYAFWWPIWRLRWEAEGSTKAAELRDMPGIDGRKGLFDLRALFAGSAAGNVAEFGGNWVEP